MKIIELQPIREWQEKVGDNITGRIWIYVGGLHVGICTRVKNQTGDVERYFFSSVIEGLYFSSKDPARTLDEIKTDVDATLKEFAVKIVKSYRTFKKVDK